MYKKVTALIIALVLAVSSIPPGLVARAADGPPVITRVYLRTETNDQGEETIRYDIYGSNFDSPMVSIDGMDIMPTSYNSSMIQIKWAEGVPDIIFWSGIKSITVKNSDGEESDSVSFDVTTIPYVSTVNKSKVYVGEPLEIRGSGFSADLKKLIIAGTEYTVGSSGEEAIIVDDGLITVDQVKPRSVPGIGSVWVTRDAGGGTGPIPSQEAIQGTLTSCVTVVGKLTGILVNSLEPDSGPVNGGTIIRMYGAPGQCSFQDNMKVYIGGVPATEVKVIEDDDGVIIGLQAKTPPGTPGSKEVIIRNFSETSEYVVPFTFNYLQTGNFLMLQSVDPIRAKETEEREITIGGRNIATINVAGVEVSDLVSEDYDEVANEYILVYNGTYIGDPVQITRKIRLTIGAIAPITDIPQITIDADIIKANTPIVTLDPQEPQIVDVVMNTETTVTLGGEVKVRRTEEYVLPDIFTYEPSRTIPVITGITPDRGPYDQDIHITIEGEKFQIFTGDDGITRYPVVRVGNKIIDPNAPGPTHHVYVTDAEGNPVDGKKITLGTTLRTIIPEEPDGTLGFVDVTVTNPDLGSSTAENLFEYKSPSRPPGDMPVIDGIDPDKGSVDGGEPATIFGRNFDNIKENLIVTIGGAPAKVENVNSAGTQIDIVTPKGIGGYQTVQVINLDGSMATLVDGYYYSIVASSPVIEVIAPDQGGAGTQVVIKGQDFRPAEPSNELIHKKLGTRVLLNGTDIDDFTVDGDGNIIYGPDGQRTHVVDEFTIKITIPPDLSVGPKDVTVVNPDTASYTVEDGFNYKYPASKPRIYDITGDDEPVTPKIGTVQGGTVVTIEGEDFREGIRVFFGGSEATNVTLNGNGTVIQATTSAYTIHNEETDSEEVDVTVVNYDGGSATAPNGFTYMIPYSNPIITSLNPNHGSTAGGDKVTIYGVDFRETDSKGDYNPPKVYFGGIEAKLLNVGDKGDFIYVETPTYPEDGRVDVTVVNADAGTYILKNGFEYRQTKPEITGIVPDKGSKLGNEEILIYGSGFRGKDLSAYYEGETVYKHVYNLDPEIEIMVVFGDETEDAIISGGYAEVTLGDIKTVYDYVYGEDSTSLYHISSDGSEDLIATYDIIPGEQHLFIVNGSDDLGNDTIVDEGIMVEISNNVLKVTRRVAPYAVVVDDSEDDTGTIIAVRTPPYAIVEQCTVYVINPDGGTATGTFEYMSPDSHPQITNIIPSEEEDNQDYGGLIYVTRGSVEAETYVTIEGSDFRTGVRVYVDNIEAEVVSKSNNDDRIVIKVPPADESYLKRLLKFVVINRDGGTADSSLLPVPYYFRYERPESNPVIDTISPDKTSAAGGNPIVIRGDDFRDGATVSIGGKDAPVIGVGEEDQYPYNRLTVLSPEGLAAGVYDVQVRNPDFGTATKEDAITIISCPRIEYITNENGNPIGTISFLGGETIILKGLDFQSGARVVFGGEIMFPKQAPPGQGIQGTDSQDQEIVVVGGNEATGVEFVDENTLKITTPTGVEGSTTIIVINPDGGVSDELDLEYTLPLPGAPEDLDVSLVYDRYVRLEWPEVEDALYYEIYASEDDDDDFQFITSTTRTVYYVIDLDSDTRYYFMVKAINKFGSSEFTNDRSIKTDDTRERDPDGKINESEKILVDRDQVTVNIGEDATDRGYYYAYEIDLAGAAYSRTNHKRINFPLEVIREAQRIFMIDAGDLMLQFVPSALNVKPLWSKTRSQLDDVYGQLMLDLSSDSETERARKYLPAKHRVVSNMFYIGMSILDGKETEQFDQFNSPIDIQIKYQSDKLGGIKESALGLYRFDPVRQIWEPAEGAGVHTNMDMAYGRITKSGIYAVLGKN